MVLALVSFAYAGDSVTIGIGCTIPAIPGVNAPPFPDSQAVKADSNSADTQQNTQRKERNLSEDCGYSVIVKSQQDDKQLIAENTTDPSGSVQTVYSR